MMKLTFAIVLAIVAIANADSMQQEDQEGMPTKACEVFRGKKLNTFSDTIEKLNIPCKYNAIRDTVCGDWSLIISPGNLLEPQKHIYITESIWFSMKHTTSGLKWEARVNRRTAQKFLDGTISAPFVKKDGHLNASEIVKFEAGENNVSLREKNDQFKLTFNVFDVKNKISGFKFECYSETFEPSDYSHQLCGNGTQNEVKKDKKSKDFKGNRKIPMFVQLFSEIDGFKQKPGNCEAAMRILSRKCKKAEDRNEAVRKCWRIMGQRKYFRPMSIWYEDPARGFKHCLEFVCSDYKDKNACHALDADLQGFSCLRGISDKVMEVCNPNHACI